MLISVFIWGAYFWLSFYESIEKNFAFVIVSERSEILIDDFSGFCSPEFYSFLRDLAIARLKCNEQHSSIPKSQIKILTKFS